MSRFGGSLISTAKAARTASSRHIRKRAADCAAALGMRVGNAEGVGRRAVAHDLAVDIGAAGLGLLEGLLAVLPEGM